MVKDAIVIYRIHETIERGSEKRVLKAFQQLLHKRHVV